MRTISGDRKHSAIINKSVPAKALKEPKKNQSTQQFIDFYVKTKTTVQSKNLYNFLHRRIFEQRVLRTLRIAYSDVDFFL